MCLTIYLFIGHLVKWKEYQQMSIFIVQSCMLSELGLNAMEQKKKICCLEYIIETTKGIEIFDVCLHEFNSTVFTLYLVPMIL